MKDYEIKKWSGEWWLIGVGKDKPSIKLKDLRELVKDLVVTQGNEVHIATDIDC
jgi:hypothetical protein